MLKWQSLDNIMKIISTNISTNDSTGKAKYPVAEIVVTQEGIIGDKHAGIGNRQVSILTQESLDAFNARTGHNIKPGEFTENLTVSGISGDKINVLDRLKINDLILEVTQLGKKCYGEVCEIYQRVGQCTMPQAGYFARVIQGGTVKPGDTIEFLPRPLRILIITLSDRASAGIYPDKSGPAAKETIATFFAKSRWHWQIDTLLQNDDADKLKQSLTTAIQTGVDVVFTLGGTGLGVRDSAPEVVTSLCDKNIPGIMESIRVKYGQDNPRALLSRSIAAFTKQTLIYTLPGSVKAGQEYLTEIFRSLEHTIHMLHGLDAHVIA